MWHRAALVALLVVAGGGSLQAQAWNDPRTRDLVTRATHRRLQQLADSTLVDYRASARGYLTFLAQLGEGFLLPPKVIKADELALEVHWKAPNHSKQWILGRRDTLVLPTDIQYHRDHLGIVQNNFPEIIRLGDGDEVRDVPHPLSRPGLVAYDFAIADSLRFELPGRTLDVYEVKVRPRNDAVAAAVGSVYLARDDAQVVRMAFSFTRAALKDRQLEDVSIILENSLIEGRYWLPRRQEIEIRRTGSWMDFPVKGIIRGRWEVRDYTVNAGGTVALSPGPEIVFAPAERRAAFRFPPTPLLDSLPADVTFATGEDVRLVQEEARRLVRAQALARTRQTLPSARGFSDIAQVNRVEGIALGGGLRRQLGHGLDVAMRARWGTADREGKGTLILGWQRADGFGVRLSGYRDFREVGDEPEASRARNSIAAQEFGTDLTQPIGAMGASLRLGGATMGGWQWSTEATAEQQERLQVHATPSRGRFEPLLPVPDGRMQGVSLRLDRPPRPVGGWSEVRVRSELRWRRYDPDSGERVAVARAWGTVDALRPLGRGSLALRVGGGTAGGGNTLPPQESFLLGGPVTAPGYGFHQLRGDAMVNGRVELRRPVPFPSIPLGRWGRLPGTATAAPFVGGALVRANDGWTTAPFIGLGVLTVLDVVRIDVARGLKGEGGRWRFGVDVTRDFWPIL